MSAFSSVDGKPLCFWTEDRLRALAACIDIVLAGWKRAWGLPASASATVCAPATARDEFPRPRSLGRNGDAAAWLLESGARSCQLAARLFSGDPETGSIAADVARACESDLLSRLRAALALQEGAPDVPPREARRPWSGWVLARPPGNAVLLLSPEVVRSVVDVPAPALPARRRAFPGEALVPVQDAFARSGVRVRVELEECELDLGVLNELQCGDVLRLKHRLDAPAVARHAQGDILFGGYLVRRGGRRALELKPHAAAGGEQP